MIKQYSCRNCKYEGQSKYLIRICPQCKGELALIAETNHVIPNVDTRKLQEAIDEAGDNK